MSSGWRAVDQLAHEQTAATRSQAGVLTYRWNCTVDSDRYLIEEEYSATETFGEHMAWMASSGQMRNLGGAFKAREVLILSGDATVVRSQLGPSPTGHLRGNRWSVIGQWYLHYHDNSGVIRPRIISGLDR
jgi:quinol monooxygenase YgiN